MNHPATDTIEQTTIDPARIAAVVREVIARIQQANTPTIQSNPLANATATTLSDKVITVATIETLPGRPSQIVINAKAIVTPAARDEAKTRGITFSRNVEAAKNPVQPTEKTASQQEIIDFAQPERAAALSSQLSRRGVHLIGSTIVLSKTPASDVFRYCNIENQRAVMLSSIADVDRFANELHPTVWVFDMKRMNLMTAVNAAVQIAQKS